MARRGSWPTPTQHPEAPNLGANRVEGPNSLAECARNGSPLWPTPRAEDSESCGAHRGQPDTLTTAVKLSPDWVEWLMGWPVGWSSLESLQDATVGGWDVDPGDTGEVPRTTGGCANRRARLRAIGNGQVPRCAAEAFSQLVTRAYA